LQANSRACTCSTKSPGRSASAGHPEHLSGRHPNAREHLPVDFCLHLLYDPAENCVIVTSVGSHSEALAMELAMTARARVEIDQNGLSQCVQGRLVYEPDITQVPFRSPSVWREGL